MKNMALDISTTSFKMDYLDIDSGTESMLSEHHLKRVTIEELCQQIGITLELEKSVPLFLPFLTTRSQGDELLEGIAQKRTVPKPSDVLPTQYQAHYQRYL
jgi:hypothetical protein